MAALLPASLLPPNASAMERTIEAAARPDALPVPIAQLWNADTCPEALLPWLAWALRVGGFDMALTPAQQRALIKNSIALHRTKGTVWAIKQVLVTLGMIGIVSEWFDYGGPPYHFRIDVDLSGRGMGAGEVERLSELVGEYKSARSHLEALTLNVSVRSQTPRIGAACYAGEVVSVLPWRSTDLTQNHTQYLAVACWALEQVSLYPQEF